MNWEPTHGVATHRRSMHGFGTISSLAEISRFSLGGVVKHYRCWANLAVRCGVVFPSDTETST